MLMAPLTSLDLRGKPQITKDVGGVDRNEPPKIRSEPKDQASRDLGTRRATKHGGTL